jgi:hypothetical protein
MRISLTIFLVIIFNSLFAQSKNGFPFGAIGFDQIKEKKYLLDSSAEAVVLNEFGETHISNSEPFNLILDYHVRIKILKKTGFDRANFEIPLRVNGKEKEVISDIRASTFNFEENKIVEKKINPKNIFSESRNKFRDYKKFTLPDIREGSIIEVSYVLESPFIFNWRTWEFQTDIPKVYSEFWAKIPGNYIYNITLRGLLSLSKNESGIVKDCYSPGGGMTADCALMKYAMRDIPAFKEEMYMTAKSNFISYINFELSEIKRFDGQVRKYTEEWKDVDRRLKDDDQFGVQLKQAKKLFGNQMQLLTTGIDDPVQKAKFVFNEIKKHYNWNEVYGYFTEQGVKKAYQTQKGNVADINLSLVGALQSIGIKAEPALLSTRANGLPVMLHPVMSDFNYVIAHITIGTDQYWLDATNPLYSFGFVPEKCLNGKIRLMNEVSEWVDLKLKEKDKKVTEVQLVLKEDGSLFGTFKQTHFGYDAFNQREKYFSFSSKEDYVKSQAANWPDFEVINYVNLGTDSLEKPFIEIYNLKFSEAAIQEVFYLSPFIIESWKKNPFQSTERTYPVDFGAPLEQSILFSLTFPDNYIIDELPKNTAVSLPKGGGRLLFNSSMLGNKVQVGNTLSISKSVYNSEEYFTLKELFARIIQVQQSQIVIKKKK